MRYPFPKGSFPSVLRPKTCQKQILSVCRAVGSHGVGALQDHGAGAGGGRPAAPAACFPAEGGRCISVPATDQQAQGPGPGPGEKGGPTRYDALPLTPIEMITVLTFCP